MESTKPLPSSPDAKFLVGLDADTAGADIRNPTIRNLDPHSNVVNTRGGIGVINGTIVERHIGIPIAIAIVIPLDSGNIGVIISEGRIDQMVSNRDAFMIGEGKNIATKIALNYGFGCGSKGGSGPAGGDSSRKRGGSGGQSWS